MGGHDREGVDADGFIVSGADVELIPEAYRPVLESVVSTLVAAVDGLISVYLYGSVATGEACPPRSDIDVLVVTVDSSSSEAVADAAKDLSWGYRHLAREVGIAHATLPGLFGDDIDALGGRCFIKHYCVPLHGDDIRDQLPSYRPSATMAWAFNHNVADAIDEARQRLDTAKCSGDVKHGVSPRRPQGDVGGGVADVSHHGDVDHGSVPRRCRHRRALPRMGRSGRCGRRVGHHTDGRSFNRTRVP